MEAVAAQARAAIALDDARIELVQRGRRRRHGTIVGDVPAMRERDRNRCGAVARNRLTSENSMPERRARESGAETRCRRAGRGRSRTDDLLPGVWFRCRRATVQLSRAEGRLDE
jgi:hypothetical protein